MEGFEMDLNKLNKDLCRIEEELESEIIAHERDGDVATVRSLAATHGRVGDVREQILADPQYRKG